MDRTTKKQIFLVIGVVLAAALAVCGGGLSDYANKPFWWNFWAIAAWVGFAVCAIGYIYLTFQEKRENK